MDQERHKCKPRGAPISYEETYLPKYNKKESNVRVSKGGGKGGHSEDGR